ncbi:hypothetical protein [Nitrosomonas sp.]|uniref:hypothetical protein n=1 Tax=Nitrosomonas sp. TaxID=42353 RepID=UPI0025D4F027|nr:hypothetical protein [Nitrosomonas sp.]MBV6447440.1 hypothetical protein [Nitrosomonas sp.]
MKLLLRRDQKSGMLGKVIFTVSVRAELSDEEKTNIKKYKMGDILLYERSKIVDPGSGLVGLASRLAFKMINLTISVNDLEHGKQVECKDILEMLAVEEQIKEAAQNFRNVLSAATTFGGEEILEIN